MNRTIYAAAHPLKNTARILFLLLVFIASFFHLRALPKYESSLPPTAYDGESRLRSMLLENSVRKILERRAWLSNEHSEGIFFQQLKSNELWYMFSPTLPCFWTLEKDPSSAVVRDGGKWLCGLHEVHKIRSIGGRRYGIGESHYDSPCIVYSMGSANEFSFERRVRTVAPGCEIHTFDPTVMESGKGKDAYDSYHGDYGFGGQDSQVGPFPIKSIATIMKELNHTHVDYLKIDVEGFEWNFFLTVDWKYTKVGQILIEVHPWNEEGKSNAVWQPTAGYVDSTFAKLEEAGYHLISLEPVTKTNIGQVELVFMNIKWQPSGNW